MKKRLIRQLRRKKPDLVRYSKEMRDVLYDQEWIKTAKNFPVYYVWREVRKPRGSNSATLRGGKNGLRYDITLIPPRMLGKEFVKTKGNRNSKGFPELYTVLEGEAIFLLQKMKEKTVKEVLAIKTQRNEWAIASSDYIVVTINPSKKRLRMGNWVSEKNKNIYGEIEPFGGMAYFYTKDGWIKNKNYKKIPRLRFKKPLKSSPKKLDFLI